MGCLLTITTTLTLTTLITEVTAEGFFLSEDNSAADDDFLDLVDHNVIYNQEEYIQSKEEEDNRIVGGYMADSNLNFMAFVYWHKEELLNRSAQAWSATVLNEQWLLTAAQCIPEKRDQVFVRLACLDITS